MRKIGSYVLLSVLFCLVLQFIAVNNSSAHHIITTIAGNGTSTFKTESSSNGTITVTGDGGSAVKTSLAFPGHLFLDGKGNIYVPDTEHNRVRKIDIAGTVTTVAGSDHDASDDGGVVVEGIPAAEAALSSPLGVFVSGNGNVMIADADTNRIRKINNSGKISTFAGSGSTAGFSGDNGLATKAKLSFPSSVFIDTKGNTYIADSKNRRIRKVDTTGEISTVAGSGLLVFSDENIPATQASLTDPFDVVVDDIGNYFIADRGGHRIYKVDTNGIITTVAGNGSSGFAGDGGAATQAALNEPEGVSVDSKGNIYIADTKNNRIRKVDSSGIITTVAGSGKSGSSGDEGPALNAQLSSPSSVVVDKVGNIFIADSKNHKIRVAIPSDREIPLKFNDEITGEIVSPYNNSDFFYFRADEGDFVSISVTSTSTSGNKLDIRLGVDGAKFKDLFRDSAAVSDEKTNAVVKGVLPVSGTYTTFVSSDLPIDTSVTYTIKSTKEKIPVDDALLIELNSEVKADIGVANEIDFYKFKADAGDSVEIQMTRIDDTLNPYLQLFTTEGKHIAINNNISSSDLNAKIAAAIPVGITFGGTYIIAANDCCGGTGSYKLKLDKTTKGTPTPTATPDKFGPLRVNSPAELVLHNSILDLVKVQFTKSMEISTLLGHLPQVKNGTTDNPDKLVLTVLKVVDINNTKTIITYQIFPSVPISSSDRYTINFDSGVHDVNGNPIKDVNETGVDIAEFTTLTFLGQTPVPTATPTPASTPAPTVEQDILKPIVMSPAELILNEVAAVKVQFSESMDVSTIVSNLPIVRNQTRLVSDLINLNVLGIIDVNTDKSIITFSLLERIDTLNSDTYTINFNSNVTDVAGNGLFDLDETGVDMAEFNVDTVIVTPVPVATAAPVATLIPTPSAAATFTPELTPVIDDSVELSIMQVNKGLFPIIELFVSIRNSNNSLSNLNESNFSVEESHSILGTSLIPVQVSLPGENAGVSIALVIDVSESMQGPPLEDVKNAAKNLVSEMNDFDRLAIIKFGNETKDEVLLAYTGNKELMIAAIDSLDAEGNSALFDGIYSGIDETVAGIGSKAVVCIADGIDINSKRSVNDLIIRANSSSIPVFTIALGDGADAKSLEKIANQTMAVFFQVNDSSEIEGVYSSIIKRMREQYRITFLSANPVADGAIRSVKMDALSGGNADSATFSYFPDGGIDLQRLKSTIDSGLEQHLSNSDILIEAEITAETDAIEGALFFRVSGTMDRQYREIPLKNSMGNVFNGVVPSIDIKTPGLDYYLTATDGFNSISDPFQDPWNQPFSVAVEPNSPPVIEHSPVTETEFDKEIVIEAIIGDTTNFIKSADIFYRPSGLPEYISIPMEDKGFNVRVGVIPGSVSGDNGIDYYIQALDDAGVAAFNGLPGNPYHIVERSIVKFPDLVVGSFDLKPQNVEVGGNVSVSLVVVNTGDQDTGGFAIAFVLSLNNETIDNGLKVNVFNLDGVSANTSKTVKISFIMPDDTEPGLYNISAILDIDDNVEESVEDNNTVGAQITVSASDDDMDSDNGNGGDDVTVRLDAEFSAGLTDVARRGRSVVVFTDKSKGFITSWQWDFGDGTTSFLQNPVHFYKENGKYSVSLTVSNRVNSDTENKADFITVDR